MINPRAAAAAFGLAVAALVAGCTDPEPSGLPPLGSVAGSTAASSGVSTQGASSSAGTPQESGTGGGPAPDAALPDTSLPVADDPAAVVTAFADDFLAMLSNPGDPALRQSQWAGEAGLAIMAARGEAAAADQLTATGSWQLRVDEVSAADLIAVVSGCIDVSQVAAFRAGEPAPFPGDLIAFSADADRRQGRWLVSSFSIPGQACPDA